MIGMPAQMDPVKNTQYLSRDYSNAIAESGGIPLVIPLLETADSLLPAIETLDGILLTGSNSDLDPSLYGATRSDKCGCTHPLRDRMDAVLLETAVRRRIPVLAVCYGFQSLNVFFGGSLIQDIPTCVDTPIRHNDSEARPASGHSVEFSTGSILEQIAGAKQIEVNSTHHQAIERTGKNLEVVARAPDGIIESVFSLDETHWMLGVQWHPEKSFYQDTFSRKLFEYFLARCRAIRGMDEGSHS